MGTSHVFLTIQAHIIFFLYDDGFCWVAPIPDVKVINDFSLQDKKEVCHFAIVNVIYLYKRWIDVEDINSKVSGYPFWKEFFY